MRLLLQTRFGRYRLADRRGLTSDEQARVVHAFELRGVLEQWLADEAWPRPGMALVCEQLDLAPPRASCSDDERREFIDRAVRRLDSFGGPVLLREPRLLLHQRVRPAEEESRGPKSEDPVMFEAQVFWRPGKPLIDTQVALVDPDGARLASGTTDATGWVRFPGKFPADCTVETLRLPVSWMRTLHVRFLGADRHTPVADEEVKFTEWGEEQSAKTDEKGLVCVPELTDTFYTVTVKGKKLRVPTVPSGNAPVIVYIDPETIDIKARELEDEAAPAEHEEEVRERHEVELDGDVHGDPSIDEHDELEDEHLRHDDHDDFWHDHLDRAGGR